MKTFENIAKEIVELHARKNHDYGNAFADSYKEFGLTSAIIRLNDKMNRLKSLNGKEGLVKDESVKDTLMDLAAYAIMTIEAMVRMPEVDTRKHKVLTQEKLEEIWKCIHAIGIPMTLETDKTTGVQVIGVVCPEYKRESMMNEAVHIKRDFQNFGYDIVLDIRFIDDEYDT